MQSYEESIGTDNDVMLLDAESDFFRYLGNQPD